MCIAPATGLCTSYLSFVYASSLKSADFHWVLSLLNPPPFHGTHLGCKHVYRFGNVTCLNHVARTKPYTYQQPPGCGSLCPFINTLSLLAPSPTLGFDCAWISTPGYLTAKFQFCKAFERLQTKDEFQPSIK